ncbi:MAG: sulfite exporter TauE/SafE family protein [Armatimonadetes bacterium]|nr:sulfite exporter TauE/SafE family protein [Armatimonadota bacterium]
MMGFTAVAIMGLVLGLLGGGGGVLTVPILVSLFHIEPVRATGCSLFVVGSTSLVGAVQGLVKRQYDPAPLTAFAACSIVGAFTARRFLVPSLPPLIFGVSKGNVLMGAFVVTMVYVGVRMMLNKSSEKVPESRPVWILAALGLAIGVVSGFLGAGGGFLIVPALSLVLGYEMTKAVPASLFVIALQSLAGFAGELGQPIPWTLLLEVTAIALVGMAVGLAVRPRVDAQRLRKGFSVLVLLVAVYMAAQLFMNRS